MPLSPLKIAGTVGLAAALSLGAVACGSDSNDSSSSSGGSTDTTMMESSTTMMAEPHLGQLRSRLRRRAHQRRRQLRR